MDMDLEHQLFEAWLLSENFHGFNSEATDEADLERDPSDGGYLDAYVHGAWLAWNASISRML